MIEYLYNAIRATAGEPITITAQIDMGGMPVENCHINLYDNEKQLSSTAGTNIDNIWTFTIPADVTTNLAGRYWYCICSGSEHNKLCFKQPIYLV